LNFNEQHIDQFNAYLKRQLSADDIMAFEKRLKTDPEFAKEFELHSLLVEGIKEHARTELKSFLKDNVSLPHISSKPNFFNMRSMQWSIAAAIVLILGVILIVQYYIKPSESTEELATRNVITSSDTSTPLVQSEPKESSDTSPEFIEMLAVKKENADMEAPPLSESLTEETSAGKPVVVDEADGKFYTDRTLVDNEVAIEDNNIATEQRLNDTTITLALLFYNTAYKKDYNSNDDASNAQPQTTDKTTKSKSKYPYNAGVEATNKNEIKVDTNAVSKKLSKASTKTYKVEYWKSPVNFKGYRFINNTVYLYGVTKDNSKLFVVNNKLYLRTNNTVYILTPTTDSLPYKTEADTDISNYILKQ